MKKTITLLTILFMLSGINSYSQFTTLHNFVNTAQGGGGSHPNGDLFFDGTFLYGMTYDGGANNLGIIFKIKPDGSGFLNIFDFHGTTDGSYPYGSLISDGTFLYGMTSSGGTNNYGTIFKIKPDGTNFVILKSFTSAAEPHGSLYYDGTFLYGMARLGTDDSSPSYGGIFKIKPDGTEYSTIFSFNPSTGTGRWPYGSLISDGTFLYGMTNIGTGQTGGTVFKVKKDGTGFVVLHVFGNTTDGNKPYGSLVYDGTFLYGMTHEGGTGQRGTIFKIKLDGTNYLKILDSVLSSGGVEIGGAPYGSLFYDGSTYLYGMSPAGGTGNSINGAIFKIKTDGSSPQNLYNFPTNSSKNPVGSLISDGTFLYGMTADTDSVSPSFIGSIFKFQYCNVSVPIVSNNGPVCTGSTLSLTASTVTGATYSWTGPNGFTSTDQNPLVSTNATTAMGGTYNCIAHIDGCSSQAGTTNVIINQAIASNNGPVCEGNQLTLTASVIPGATYFWSGPNGFSSSSQNPTVSINATLAMAGVYSVYTVANGCTSSTPGTTTVVINTIPASPTAGNNGPVCIGNTLSLTASTVAGATYSWTGPNGFTSTQQNPTISTSADATMGGVYNVIAIVNGCSSGIGTTTVEINKITATNNGPVCVANPLILFATPVTGAVYSWTGPNGFSSSQQNPTVSNSATTAMAGVYSVTSNANGCASAASVTIVTINPAIATPTVSPTVTYCQNATATQLTATGSNLLWYTSAVGGIGSSTAPIPVTTIAGTTTYYVSQTTSCESPRVSITVTVNPLPANAGTITGSATVCQGQNGVTYTVPSIANATSYVWTLPTGVTGTSTTNSITVNFGTSAVSGNITVKGTNSCGNGAISTLAIIVNPLVANAGSITGSATVCQGQNGVTYTVPSIANATSYVWTLPNGATGTSTINSISVNYGSSATSGNITVKGNNSCGFGTFSTLAINVNSIPLAAGTISGSSTVCQGQNSVIYTIPVISGVTSYVWTLPNGVTGTSTTNSINVNFSTSAVSGGIEVYGQNSCGSGSSSIIAVSVNSYPVSAGTILGSTTVCQGQNTVTYTVPSIANATSYVWTLPNGATGTSNSSSITVNYGTSAISGNITVKGNNSCGFGNSSSLPIIVNSLPSNAGTISGTTSLCQGQTSVFYAVPSIANATSYSWTVPSGASGISTTNTINVNYSNSSVSGNLIVSGNNSCGSGTSFSLPITVIITPTPTGNISQNFTQGQTLSSLQVTGTNLIWYANQSDAINHVSPITNATLLVNGATYYVTQTNNGCESAPLGITVTVALGINDFQKDEFIYYPNPVNSILNFENNNPILKITLFNLLGQRVEEKEINSLSGQLDMSKLPTGNYLLKFKTDNGESAIKLIKN